jgi:anti-sigma28 factor (negative regulator of flagellin synthesis)
MSNEYYEPQPDVAPGTKARSGDLNALDNGVAAAFDKLPPPTALASGTVNYAQDAGNVANGYVVTLPKITAYTDGLSVKVNTTRANTGAATLNINGIGAIAIKRLDGTDLQADDIQPNAPVALTYVAETNRFMMPNLVASQIKQAATSATNAAASAQSAAQSAQAAATSAAQAAARVRPMRNAIINGNFAINQRAVSGTVTLAANAYGHDRWKAGAAGCTYTFASNGCDTTITITAGSLMQVVEGPNIEGGVYTLSRAGTSLARIGINGAAPAGGYAATPITSASATAGQVLTVEFNVGTLGLAQLEQGTFTTLFERRHIGQELILCRRYGRPIYTAMGGYTTSGTTNLSSIPLDPPMRTTPTFTPGATLNNGSVSGATVQVIDGLGVRHSSTGTASGAFYSVADGFLSAEL